ncbi:MAG: cyclic nucleotide-binding domain-containing protein [Chitinophagaceae bacterium]
MNQDLDVLKNLINQIYPISAEAMEEMCSIWAPFYAGRKELITRTGETERYIYVVLDGVQRVYYSDEQDREATILFTYTPSFGGVLDSFLLQTPSRYHCEALTPSHFLRTTYQQFSAVRDKHHSAEGLVSKGLAGVIGGLEERLVEIQCFSSEDKLRSLLKRSPHILQLVPHKYLASYLGIDATNFSKLLAKILRD